VEKRHKTLGNFLKLWPARFVEGEPRTGDLWPPRRRIMKSYVL
jgi:hypothetical protein